MTQATLSTKYLDDALVLSAADISLSHGLTMADSVVLATARHFGAKVVTLDQDFQGLAEAILI